MGYNLNGLQYETVKSRKKDKKTYINIECAFDIETTSTYIDEDEKAAFMYAWVFGIKDENFIFRGRTWEDFIELNKALQEYFQLSEDRVLVCYVHNLGFEFQFMRKYFKWNIFSVDNRKPIVATNNYGIEFRDSLILSGYNLENLAKNLVQHKIEKKVGDLDYSLIRHHETELSETEWSYIEHDVLILLYYINEQLSIYKDVTRIPLTNTSRVRDYVRNKCYYGSQERSKRDRNQYAKYRNLMKDLQLDPETYLACRNAFQGGYVHANANKVGKIIKDVTSMDFTSSYPAVMVSEKFPMSKPFKIKVDKDFNLKECMRKYNLIFTVRFKNITSKFYYESYISESHCQRLRKPILNNGRVFSADELITTITDVDFQIIQQVYDWEDMQIANVYGFYKAYLPKPIIESIIELYGAKTELKGVKGKEVEYVLAKGMLNSIYGMTVTDIVKDPNVYDDSDDTWDVNTADIEESVDTYNDSKKRFLYYPWGVFITAYARRNLWYGITAMGEDYIYSDTDSIKFTNYEKRKPFFEQYNKLITKKVQMMCNHYNIDYNLLQPKTIEGIRKPIGVWELDGKYSMFKTLGAKRYIVEHADSKELELTCSGLPKDAGISYLKKMYNSNIAVMEHFDDDLYIPAEETGSMVHTYIDHKCIMDITDYQGKTAEVVSLSGVHLENESFTLSMTENYIQFIENLQKGYVYKGRKRLS